MLINLVNKTILLATILVGVLVLTPGETFAQVDDLIHHTANITVRPTTFVGKTKTHFFDVETSSNAYNGFVLSGSATGKFSRGFVRFIEANGPSSWEPLTYMQGSSEEMFVAGYRSDTYRQSVNFELRFEQESDAVLELHQIGVFDNRLDDDRLSRIDNALESIENPIAPTQVTIIPPTLIPRGEWGARSFAGSPVPLAQPNYRRMTFHHAACCGAETYAEGLVQVKGIQDFHQNVRGWSDIGYHFIFDQQGRLYQGRPFLDNRTNLDRPPLLAQGAHVGGNNTGNIGVSVLGCYHPAEGAGCEDIMSPALKDSVLTLFAYLSERYGVDAGDLLGHRDQLATSCPGDNNYPLLPALRTAIDELILTGNQPIAFASLNAQTGLDGVVQLSWSFSEIFDVASYRIDRETESSSFTVLETSDVSASTFADASVGTDETVQYALYAISSAGVEQRLSSASAAINLLEEFQLGENFPNPFNSTTTIRYFLDQEGIVTLKVYDASGRRLLTPVDEYQEGGQWYQATVHAGNLANGTYYYRLQVEGFSSIVFDQTRAMVVVN